MIKREELTNPQSCMSRARDDEMTFVLLERDVAAPWGIRAWVERRLALGKNKWNDPQIIEAKACADLMEERALAGAAALPSTPNDDVLNRLIEGQRLEFVRLRRMFSEDSLSLLANRIQSELGDGGLVQEHRDIMRILVDYFKDAQPREAPAASVPAASSAPPVASQPAKEED